MEASKTVCLTLFRDRSVFSPNPLHLASNCLQAFDSGALESRDRSASVVSSRASECQDTILARESCFASHTDALALALPRKPATSSCCIKVAGERLFGKRFGEEPDEKGRHVSKAHSYTVQCILYPAVLCFVTSCALLIIHHQATWLRSSS